MIAVLNCVPLLSQPGTGNSFSVYRNIAYSKKENSSLLLDIYIPGGKAMAGGIGVAGKDPKSKTSENTQVASIPVVIWLTGPERSIFPTPIAGLVGNGYAVASFRKYLPEDNSSSNNRYPFIYWLHGDNGKSREGAWMCKKMNEALQKSDMPNCIVVFVQGLPTFHSG